MSPITRLTFQQQKYEGNFRFTHNRIRTFVEVHTEIDDREYHTSVDHMVGLIRSLDGAFCNEISRLHFLVERTVRNNMPIMILMPFILITVA